MFHPSRPISNRHNSRRNYYFSNISLFYLKVDDLTVSLIYNTTLFRSKMCLVSHTEKTSVFILWPISKRCNSRRNEHFSNRSFLFEIKWISSFIDAHNMSIRWFNHFLEIWKNDISELDSELQKGLFFRCAMQGTFLPKNLVLYTNKTVKSSTFK